jgi:hypothetical protein
LQQAEASQQQLVTTQTINIVCERKNIERKISFFCEVSPSLC